VPEDNAVPHRSGLLRALGRWDLTALGVNQVIGGAVFAAPAALAAQSGAWSPWLIVGVGLASLLVALSLAEVASRFDATGGPYLYARTAFGRFAGFEVGWMTWITRVASWASILNILVASIGYYWPAATSGPARVSLIVVVVAAITLLNLRGIRQSSFAVNTFTCAKLFPLAAFIGIGIWWVDPSRALPHTGLSFEALSASALLLIFVFGGYENVPIPAGEARDPRRGVPFALIATILIVSAVFTLVQIVALGTLPALAQSGTPLADAAGAFMGPGGAALLTAGAVVSIAGANLGGALTGSRTLYALAEQGDIPAFFARLHVRYRTPVNAIVATSLVTLVLALSGTFVALAQVSAISRLVTYLAACSATLRLRGEAFVTRVGAPAFVPPLAPVVPWAAIGVALTILAGATRENLLAGLAALAAGAFVYTVARARREDRASGGAMLQETRR
jgi:amino acid transporter